MPPQDNIRPNSWDIFLAGNAGPWSASVSKSEPLDIHGIATQRFGTSIVAGLIQGHNCELSLDVQEWSAANIAIWNNTLATTGAVKTLHPVGSLVPTIELRLHNPADTDNVNDIVFPAVYFHGLAINSDGTRELRNQVRATAQRDPTSGLTYQIGWVEPS